MGYKRNFCNGEIVLERERERYVFIREMYVLERRLYLRHVCIREVSVLERSLHKRDVCIGKVSILKK